MLISLFIGFSIVHITAGVVSSEWEEPMTSLFWQTLTLVAVGVSQYLGD